MHEQIDNVVIASWLSTYGSVVISVLEMISADKIGAFALTLYSCLCVSSLSIALIFTVYQLFAATTLVPLQC